LKKHILDGHKRLLNPFYEKHHSEDTKNKLREQKKGKYSGSQNMPVEIDGKVYRSAGEAGKKLALPMTTVRWRVRSSNPKFASYRYKT